MATHGIGKLKFNLSKNGLAWRYGDGETHRLFGRAKGEGDGSEYEENMASEGETDYQDDYDAQDEEYADEGYQDDRDSGYDGGDYDDDYADDGDYDDGYDGEDDYADDGYSDDDGDYDDDYAADDGYDDGGRYDDEYADEGDGDYYDDDYAEDDYDENGDFDDRYQDADADEYAEDGAYYGEQSALMRYVDENDWVTYALLFLFPPLGIYLLWRRNRFEKPVRWGLTAASAIWFVVALILLLRGLFGGAGDQQTQPSITIAPAQVEVTAAPVDEGGELPVLADLSGGDTVEEPASSGTEASTDTAQTSSAISLPEVEVEPSPTPLAGASSGGASTADYVWSPATGLYYHAVETCPRIEEGLQVWRVTKEIAENSRHQSPCPDCIGGGNTTTYYARADGKYYHSNATCSNMKNAQVYTKEAAENEGKQPCPVCILKTRSSLDEEEEQQALASGKPVMISENTKDKSGIEVYATKSGTYFHVKSDCRGMTGAIKGTLRDALLAGKKACPTCCGAAGNLVYCTRDGKHYHTDKECQGMKGAKQVTLAEALVLGKTKCDVCGSGKAAESTGKGQTVTIGNATGSDVKVYATKNGKYYHTNSTCSGMKDAQLYTLKSMLLAGKKACPTCASSAETKVYATKGGKYYHSYATCSDMTDATSGTLAEALAQGYKRCPKCWGSSKKKETATEETKKEETKKDETAAAAKATAAPASVKVQTVSPDKAQAAASKATAKNTYVYATPTSKHYHLNSSCSGMTGASRVTLKTAIDAGKTACTICAEQANRTVYSTSTGEHYHAASVCVPTGMKNGTKRTLSEALMMGQTACAYCLGSKKAATQATEAAKAIEKAVNTAAKSATYKSGSSGVRVYASLTGKYYHTRSNCTNLSGNANRVTLETALNFGKTACPVCASTATRSVYATKGGKYYHYSKADAGDGAKKGTLAAALAAGLDPCPNCVKRVEEAVSKAEEKYESGTSGIKVYATLGSKYFHAQPNCSGLTGASRVSLETALNYGKKACPVCLSTANRKVYAVPGGKYYHYVKAHAGSGATAGTLASARAYGLDPCPLCTNLAAGADSIENGGAKDAPVSTEEYAADPETGVYIDLGSANNYYHKSAKCSDAKFSGGTKVTLQYVLDWKYKACPYCNPPTRATAQSGGQ